MDAMNLKALLGLIVYVLVGIIYFFVHDYSVALYKSYVGGFASSGVAVGGTAELMFYLFIFVNSIVFYPTYHQEICAARASGRIGDVLFFARTPDPSVSLQRVDIQHECSGVGHTTMGRSPKF